MGLEMLERWTAPPLRSVETEVAERKEGTLLYHSDCIQEAGISSSVFNEHV